MDSSIASVIAGSIVAILLVGLVFFILQIVAFWKIFTKASEAGWKSIIPVYNAYVMFKIAWKPMFFWIMLGCAFLSGILSGVGGAVALIGTLLSLAVTVITIMLYYYLSRSFGHGVGFTLGLIFLSPIFLLILAFGSSEYIGNTTE